MSREALVVGINSYQHLPPLNASAGDAEAIAQFLERHGDFRVRRLPQFQDPFEHNAQRVARNQGVSLVQLEEALVQLFPHRAMETSARQ
ncbi:caspase family protein [Vacuolonema iberomarrocanum]|uniref:caspase family protein n=1 Tax=Vacuolonema iberomarrocanum TaxID=3454632 RepID=UPI0019E17DA2|nr:caspase family protein [filamentous cyanobacterium LEGE 07170]